MSIIVYISHTESPNCFYVSRADAISEMLSEEIRKRYKVNVKPVFHLANLFARTSKKRI